MHNHVVLRQHLRRVEHGCLFNRVCAICAFRRLYLKSRCVLVVFFWGLLLRLVAVSGLVADFLQILGILVDVCLFLVLHLKLVDQCLCSTLFQYFCLFWSQVPLNLHHCHRLAINLNILLRSSKGFAFDDVLGVWVAIPILWIPLLR